MKIGYARTSTVDQNYSLDAQLERLNQEGCEKVFSEQVSSVDRRPEFEKALEFCREGDVLIITKLDRFARSIIDLWKHIQLLEDKGAAFQVLDMNLDTKTANGRLQVSLLASIAQWEREMMLERQRVGIAKAKAEGKYKGRSATARAKAVQIQKMAQRGLKPSQIASALGIGVASVYRYRDAATVT